MRREWRRQGHRWTSGTAILLGHFFLGEPLEAREVIGAFVIAGALLVVDGRALRLLRQA
jgi:drug/metabolite transporter (DMT)-like permease